MFSRLATVLPLFLALGWTIPSTSHGALVSWDDAGNSAGKLWSDFGNWSPDGSPAGDDVLVGNLGTATNDATIVDQNFDIASLTITNGAEVINSTDSGNSTEFKLGVAGDTIIAGAGSAIRIYGGVPTGLDTNQLILSNGATLQLNSQTNVGTAVIEVDNGVFDINVGSIVTGSGTINLTEVPAVATPLLTNDGTITATATGLSILTPATTLNIVATSSNYLLDLDGLGDGVLNVNRNATLRIDATLADTMSGDVNLSEGATLNMVRGWNFGVGGTINVNTNGIVLGTGGAAAEIRGLSMNMTGGTISLNTSGIDSLRLATPFTSSGGTIANSGLIIFDNTATIGAGTDFQMNSDASSMTLLDNATVNIDDVNFNLDGNGTTTNITTIGNNAVLDLDLDFALADEGYDHKIVLAGGQLDVTNINAASVDKIWSLSATSTLTVNAAPAISSLDGSDVDIEGAVQIASGARLALDTSAAELSAGGKITIAGGELRGTSLLTINSPGGIEGSGTVRSRLINNTEVEAKSGTLVVETAGNDNDWDGTTGNGVLRATSGTLELRDTAAFSFSGQVRANDGQVFANGFGLLFQGGSSLVLSNSTYRSTHATSLDGTLTVLVGSPSRLQVDSFFTFLNGSNTTLNGNLLLDNTLTTVESGATLSGGGALINQPNRLLRFNDTANVGALVENQGRVEIAPLIGRVDGIDFQQTATGVIEFDLSGTGLNAFDRFLLTGQAQLAGKLEIDLQGGFAPQVGDKFRILVASAGVTGTFSALDLPALTVGRKWNIQYQPTFVELGVLAGLSCDLNNDGVADAGDAGIMFGNWGSSGLGDCNFDGIVDAADAGELFAQWTGDAGPANLPEPVGAPAWIVLILAAWRRSARG